MSNAENITLLAIESSCDDTAVSVIRNKKILSNVVAGQEVHKKYGGVVPELVSRAHLRHMIPVLDVALKDSGVTLQDLNAIAFTRGPGLLGSLLVGSGMAKGLALALGLPLVAVNHLEAHVLSHLIEYPNLEFPYLCLLVSGGHTQIIRVNAANSMDILGRTMDDAAGEAFDKAAKMMSLPYPGGPLIDKWAPQGNPHAFRFNIGKVPGLDFSFSGFKTAVLYLIRDMSREHATFVEENLSDLCASVQFTIVSYLVQKFKKASEDTGIKRLALAGGVAANSYLRERFLQLASDLNGEAFIPSFEYCTDNAAMIANAAWYKFNSGETVPLQIQSYAHV